MTPDVSEDSEDPTIDKRRGSAPGDLLEGMEVGEYRVLRKIGEGGMGSVYAAVQPVIGKRVAIKVLAPAIAANPDLVRRFVDEARAVNKIGHPNIIDIFSFGWLPDQRHYFAMEYLDGQNLADRLKRGRLPQAEARRLLRQICQALEAAHRQAIVHRDLKPDNIWIAQPQHGDSFAKLLDFGIAKLMGEGDASGRTQTGAVMGTPAYMAPEQCRGTGIDARTDIYALGVILYEMFTGRLPFLGSFAELLGQHLTATPERPAHHAPVPPALDHLIMACLEKDPARRPQSAEELARALEAALAQPFEDDQAAARLKAAPTVVAPDTLAPPPGHTANDMTRPAGLDRSRWPWVTAAGVAIAALVAVAAATGGRRHATVATPTPTPTPTPGPAPAPRPPEMGGAQTAAAPRALAGTVHVLVRNAEAARVLVDDRLVAAGVREAHLRDVTPDRPHRLRVEAPGHPPREQTFTVAAGAEVDLQIVFPAAAAAVTPERPHRREPPPARPGATNPTRPHHRDGLVGDDIFDSPAHP